MLLKPFQAVRYSLNKVDIRAVVCPPYDVISPDQQQQLYTQSPYNIVRLVLGKQSQDDTPEDNRYTRAANFFKQWQELGILTQDTKPGFYLYQQQYVLNGKQKTVNGILGLVKLEPLGQTIHPHEKTLKAPKADRLELMKACQANFCPIYAVYEDKKGDVAAILKGITQSQPVVSVEDDKIRHRLWIINDTLTVSRLRELLNSKELLIADGHHRYETALNYQREMRAKTSAKGDQPYDYVLMFLADMAHEDLTVLPTHRLIKNSISLKNLLELVKEHFQLITVASANELMERLQKPVTDLAFGLIAKEKYYLLQGERDKLSEHIKISCSKDWKRLDTALLNELILNRLNLVPNESLFFSEDTNFVFNQVNSEAATYAFILKPISLEQIMRVAQYGETMPQKSTYFYPKPLTGLVIYKF